MMSGTAHRYIFSKKTEDELSKGAYPIGGYIVNTQGFSHQKVGGKERM